MSISSNVQVGELKTADWELDFYSRPIIDPDGKKRWELLITSTKDFSEKEVFQWEKICPAAEVNSVWLTNALQEAISDARKQGWNTPKRLRCWRTAMKTMIKKAAEKIEIEVIESRRTYALLDWLEQREKYLYPKQSGYMAGPIAPPPARILNQPVPLPEALRGDAWSLASLDLDTLREAKDWPIEFKGLVPIESSIQENVSIPGLRLFSKTRALALSAWISGIDPVKLVIEEKQLILETGQDDRWLVSDISEAQAKETNQSIANSFEKANGLQFISIQSDPNDQKFAGFWILRDFGKE